MPEDKPLEGMVQVYTGDGKGKTTAALGLAMRAAGYDLRTLFVQFMKGSTDYGELHSINSLPQIEIRQFGRPELVDRRNPLPEDFEGALCALHFARQAVASNKYDLVVLDEVNVAVDFGLIGIGDLMELIENKPPCVELVLTGRYAHPEVIARADLVTEMKEVKHYLRRGISARRGIEY